MTFRSRAGVIAVSAVVAVMLALTGCSTSGKNAGSGPATSANQSDAANIVKQAADAMRKVSGAHMNLTAQGDIPNLKVAEVDGDMSTKPKPVATGTAKVSLGKEGGDQTVKFVYVDDHFYSDLGEPGKYTDFGNGASIYNIGAVLDPDKGLANVLANMKDPKSAGNEQVNGIATTKITGTCSSSDIALLAGSPKKPEQETQMPVAVWIATDGSYHLVKAELTPVSNSTITMNLSEWGKQVTATKPV
ncbi:LppX_LprAFG lipoprotein [Mycobacterium branderi]|uniref:Lipoprotein LprA n=1 Tax=Mycobacterium branderi TaxID=43348 RepID=A0A7I7WED2_9MYCO|nr:LppX_LprAFG lipoprotein [Mycobacterium branderi]MCV7236291.1 LppX_LprAFG lipoprotein [Mycobacterium branderi]ORA35464.1 hypothetical protein BST20_17900 [Mycobacterium branderi]BBZ15175.1 lipoprotein LprA [Mycobacterium branderi]